MRTHNVATLTEKQKTVIFNQDTELLGKHTARFIENFYQAYSISNSDIHRLDKENSLELLNTFTFYRLSECMVDDVDDLFSFFATKMQKLFTTAYSIKQEVCYGIVSNEGETSLVIGISPTSSDGAIKRIIEGLLPGMKIEEYRGKFINAKQMGKPEQDQDRYVGCISGIPALKLDGELQRKDLSSLMRSLNGENYTLMVLCKPMDEIEIQNKIDAAVKIKDACFAISKRTISLQNGSAKSNTHTDTYNESVGTQESKTTGKSSSGAMLGAAVGSFLSDIGTLSGGIIGLIVGNLWFRLFA